MTDPRQARIDFDEALLDAKRAAVDGLMRLQSKTAKAMETARAFVDGLQATSFERFPADAATLSALSGQLGRSRLEELALARSFISEVKGEPSTRRLDALHAAVAVAPYEAEIRDVLEAVSVAHRQALADEGALDFTELTLAARALLRDDAQARRDAHQRIGALLVDEFQDTNRVQRELVLLLSEQRTGGPRPISQALDDASAEVLRLPLEPAFLAVVGDQKQSIYEFRGADVAVFEEMAKHVEANGGRRAWLTTTWRSSPNLTQVVNDLTRRVLSTTAFESDRLPFEVVADDRDALTPARKEGPPIALVRLERAVEPKADVETLRALDADAIARHLAAQLASGAVQARQVAMLFQRLTKLEVYRQALVRYGVQHRVLRGRGFFGSREIVDVAYALRLLARPDDNFACAVVLRSPAVCVSDVTLLRLAQADGGLHARTVLNEALPSDVPAEELARLEAFRRVFHGLSRQRERLGVHDVVSVWLESLHVREALAASPFGEQALGNLEALLELTAVRQEAGVEVTAFADELIEASKREPRESPADLIDAVNDDAVTVCTVHQAKGLEWPVVVLPELFSRRPPEREVVRFERNEGLALRPFQLDSDFDAAARQQAIAALRNRRATAENLRLLYVALTRAKDQLVLGLVPPPPASSKAAPTWATVLHHALWNDVAPFEQRVAVEQLPSGELLEAEDDTSPDAEIEALAARALHPPVAVSTEAMVPVTHLNELSICPRRFHFAYQVGLPESAERDEERAQAEVEVRGDDLDVRARGTAAHRLLELTPLDQVGTPKLEARLRELSVREGLPADEQLRAWVHSFWSSEDGRRIAALGPSRVLREVPFV
ncbi:MAG: UvrD-helicase domain-containing protein, partial [Archangium sp.]|nr:UvrD-helicase domain-containing protein [Archangium sp.]